jgi:DNA sulfur modification protein DndC
MVLTDIYPENTAMQTITIPQEVQDAQVIYVSHSGGKDSQAMLAALVRLGLKDKLVLVHSDLGEMEWEPMHHWIEQNSFGLPLHIVQSDMDFFEMVRKYKRLPSGMQQFCTDFLKVKPIGAFIHEHMTANGYTKAINATGMRAEESRRRAGKAQLAISVIHQPRKFANHLIHDWLPILNYTESDVYHEVKLAGQRVHQVYSLGFSRLSCVFCVNGRIAEHQQAAKLRPALAQKMIDLEKEIGKTIRVKQVNKVKVPRYLSEYLYE